MVAIIDLEGELARLVMLAERTPMTTAAEREGALVRLAAYRDGGIFAAKFAGKGAWERHPQGDEIVHIVAGRTTLHLITAAGRQSLALAAGQLAIVPQGAWHQFEAPEGVCLITTTPQPTETVEIDVADPRQVG